MRDVIETVVGLVLIAAGLLVLFHQDGHSHPAWLIAALVGLGGVFVSKNLMLEVARAALEFLPWRKKDAG